LSSYYVTQEYLQAIHEYCTHICPQTDHAHRCFSNENTTHAPWPLDAIAPCVTLIQQSSAGYWGFCYYNYQQSAHLLSHAILQSASVDIALESVAAYLGIFSNALQSDVRRNANGSMEARVRLLPAPSAVPRFLMEVSMGAGKLVLAHLFRELELCDFPDTRMASEQALNEELDHLTLVGVLEESPVHRRLLFSRELVTAKFPHRNPALHKVLIKQLDHHVGGLPKTGSLSEHVERFIAQHLEQGLDLDRVCEHFNKSRRTLSRQLLEEGTGFVEIRDKVRQQRALELINVPGVPLKRIATLCGFNSLSAFTQAFTRWTGQSPSEYRDR
jgi:AraC-like DNA-binding protein